MKRKSTSSHIITYVSPYDHFLKRLCIAAMETTTGKRQLNRVYSEIQDLDLDPLHVWGKALDLLNIETVFESSQLAKIPKDGPLVIIANHPFGVVDGIMMGHLASLVRKRFAILVNEVLVRQDKRLEPFLLPIDFRENKEAVMTNIQTKQKAQKRLKEGEAIVIFPSGGVATAPTAWSAPEDLEWKRFTAKIIQMSRATVIPVFFHGHNSRLFQVVSQFSATLRLGMLLHEVRNKQGSKIRVEIGDPIYYEEIAEIKDRQALLDYLRDCTFALGKK